jgi:hypothetical protein
MRKTRIGSVEQRFFTRFQLNDSSGCWEWIGTKNPNGYGVIGGKLGGQRLVPAGSNMLAHRVSWLIHFGPIPDGEGVHGTVVMHKCDNRACVNPSHLAIGSQRANVHDMVSKGRKVSGTPSGVKHWGSSIKTQEDMDLICSTKGKTKELAERFGTTTSTIKAIRRRNGVSTYDAEKFHSKALTQDVISHIRSTKPGTRGLTKLYGLSKTTISRIRKGLTYKLE